MPVFRCFIRGDNFPGKLIGCKQPAGFYTTRFVDAASAEEAEMLVVELLRNDPDLDIAPKYRTENAKVYFEYIDEVPAETERKPNKGFAFFPMGTQQFIQAEPVSRVGITQVLDLMRTLTMDPTSPRFQ